MNKAQSTQWEWNPATKQYDFVGIGYTDVSGLKQKCHTGNTAIYQEPGGGTLYIGGWNNLATFDENTHVIDLTGTEHKFREKATAFDPVSEAFLPLVQAPDCKGWLSLPFPDLGTPTNITTYQQWAGISNLIQGILKNGTHVLVACLGGHGRSGIFCAIVGYILGRNSNPEWESPVEYLRKIHCLDTVETYKQEEYVYKILGLNIKIQTVYATKGSTSMSKCPICGTQSVYIKDFGMCMGCKTKFAPIAPIKTDITVEDLDNVLEHECVEKGNCIGIYTAAVCGHTVHDMVIIDGLCENCNTEAELAKDDKKEPELYGECVICSKRSFYGHWYGICYECAEDLKQRKAVDYVHNSLTDSYSSVAHTCNDTMCGGIAIADTCGHVVHDHVIEDGICEDCRKERNEV